MAAVIRARGFSALQRVSPAGRMAARTIHSGWHRHCRPFLALGRHPWQCAAPLWSGQGQQSHVRLRCNATAAGGKFYKALSEDKQAKVDQYVEMLLEYNKSVNLTAIRSTEEAFDRHIEDSLALLPVLEGITSGSESVRLVDVGTGGGLPGMVLAIAHPSWEVTLLDSLRKRVDFLQNTSEALGLGNVHCVWSRAEDAGKAEPMREAYDIAVARAVAETRILAELCMPFVRVGGTWVAAKGANVEEEVEKATHALEQLGGELVGIERVDSRGGDGQRTAVVVRKVAAMPSKFPRRAGMPNKRPL